MDHYLEVEVVAAEEMMVEAMVDRVSMEIFHRAVFHINLPSTCSDLPLVDSQVVYQMHITILLLTTINMDMETN